RRGRYGADHSCSEWRWSGRILGPWPSIDPKGFASRCARAGNRIRQIMKHRHYERAAVEIIGFHLAGSSSELFPYLCQRCKASRAGTGMRVEMVAEPALHGVDHHPEIALACLARDILGQGQKCRDVEARQGI